MPRHAFSFHQDVRSDVRAYVASRVAQVDPQRYGQEHALVTAIFHSLEGVAYDGPFGRVEFRSTIVDDRGRGAAEHWSGADVAITALVSDGKSKVEKAILAQAKKDYLWSLSSSEHKRLLGQVDKMKRLTNAPKVIDLPIENGRVTPGVYSGTALASGRFPARYDLAQYIIARVLTTFDGDTRPSFVAQVQRSNLSELRVVAQIRPSS